MREAEVPRRDMAQRVAREIPAVLPMLHLGHYFEDMRILVISKRTRLFSFSFCRECVPMSDWSATVAAFVDAIQRVEDGCRHPSRVRWGAQSRHGIDSAQA